MSIITLRWNRLRKGKWVLFLWDIFVQAYSITAVKYLSRPSSSELGGSSSSVRFNSAIKTDKGTSLSSGRAICNANGCPETACKSSETSGVILFGSTPLFSIMWPASSTLSAVFNPFHGSVTCSMFNQGSCDLLLINKTLVAPLLVI